MRKASATIYNSRVQSTVMGGGGKHLTCWPLSSLLDCADHCYCAYFSSDGDGTSPCQPLQLHYGAGSARLPAELCLSRLQGMSPAPGYSSVNVFAIHFIFCMATFLSAAVVSSSVDCGRGALSMSRLPSPCAARQHAVQLVVHAGQCSLAQILEKVGALFLCSSVAALPTTFFS